MADCNNPGLILPQITISDLAPYVPVTVPCVLCLIPAVRTGSEVQGSLTSEKLSLHCMVTSTLLLFWLYRIETDSQESKEGSPLRTGVLIWEESLNSNLGLGMLMVRIKSFECWNPTTHSNDQALQMHPVKYIKGLFMFNHFGKISLTGYL